MSLFKLTADQARGMSEKAVPQDFKFRRFLDDIYSMIQGDAKRGNKNMVVKVFGENQDFLESLKNKLTNEGYSVAFHKDSKEVTILSVGWM